jgi:hypothetical protein
METGKDILIFTMATDSNRTTLISETSEKSNIQIEIIYKEKWNGYMDKIITTYDRIKNLPDEMIVCFVDAYDVLVYGSQDEIVKKFKKYECELLLGAELNCYPERYRQYIQDSCKYAYPNSGGYIGYVKAIKRLLFWKPVDIIQRICANGGDQAYFMEYYICDKKNVKLDNKCEIFQNMHWVSWRDVEYIDSRFYNKVMNTFPCFFHFNGGSFLTDSGNDIMPIFARAPQDFDKNNQIITPTCFPHDQD